MSAMEDRHGIGEPGGLKRDAVEGRRAARPPREQVAGGAHQVAAHLAAQAAASSRTISSSLASTSRWSRPTSPNSLTITAVRASAESTQQVRSSVVFPLPRKPVTTLIGTVLIAAIGNR